MESDNTSAHATNASTKKNSTSVIVVDGGVASGSDDGASSSLTVNNTQRDSDARTILMIPVKFGVREFFVLVDVSPPPSLSAPPASNVSTVKLAETLLAVGSEHESEASCAPLRTVGELRQYLAAETGCDETQMRVVHRGRYINSSANDASQPLSALGFKRKDKLVVMGQPKAATKTSTTTKDGLQVLLNYERKHLCGLSELFARNGEDLAELQRNFLEGAMLREMLTRTEKQLRTFNELGVRHLEAIDALPIYEDTDNNEQLRQRNRDKRRELVRGVQELLNHNDKRLFELDQYRFRVEHPNEGR